MRRALVLAYTPEQHEREHLRFTCARDGEQLTLTVLSRINALNAKPLRDRALPEIDDGAKWVTLDFANVDGIERRSLGELLSIAQHARRLGGAVTIRDARPSVIDVFLENGLARPFTFARSSASSPWPVDPRAPRATR